MAKIDDFESYAHDALIVSQTKWAGGTSHAWHDSNIEAEVNDTGGDNYLYLHDHDTSAQYDVKRTFSIPSPVSQTLYYSATPTTASSNTCKLETRILETSTTLLNHWLDHSDGKIYYGAAKNFASLTATLDTESKVTTNFISNSQFKISLNDGTEQGPFSLNSTITTEINGIEFVSPSDNTYVVPEVGAERFSYTPRTEDFESYAESANMYGVATLIGDLSADPGADADLTISTQGGSKMLKHVQTGKSGTDRSFTMSLDARELTPTGATFSFRARTESGAGHSFYLHCNLAVTAFAAVNFSYTTGYIQAYDTSVWDDLVVFSADTNYDIIITLVDTAHYDVTVNGTLYNHAGAHYHLPATADNINAFQVYSWVSGKACYYDNMVCSWTTISHRVSAIGTWSHPAPSASCYSKIVDSGDAGHSSCLKIVDGSGSGAPGTIQCTFSTNGSPNGTDYIEYYVKADTTGYSVLFYEGASYRVNLFLDSSDHHIKSGANDSGLTWADNTWVKIGVLFYSTSQVKIRKDGGAWSNALNQYANWSGAGAVISSWCQSGSTAGTYTIYYDDIEPSWLYVAASTAVDPMTTKIDDISGSWIGGTLKRWDGSAWVTCNTKVKGA